MTMSINDIANIVKQCNTRLDFTYNGNYGNIDPYYSQKRNRPEYLLFYGDNEITVYSMDDVINTPFINGKSLSDIASELDFDEI